MELRTLFATSTKRSLPATFNAKKKTVLQCHKMTISLWTLWKHKKSKNFETGTRHKLHHFSDASDNGIGSCSYIRLINDKGKVHVAFFTGKSKVVPSKGLFTTPRLELMAAVMATQLSKMLHSELDMTFDDEVFWSDSMIVLGWIANASRRFNAFVHNRLCMITATIKKKQWRHVLGTQNPADIASRGKKCDQLVDFVDQYGFRGQAS